MDTDISSGARWQRIVHSEKQNGSPHERDILTLEIQGLYVLCDILAQIGCYSLDLPTYCHYAFVLENIGGMQCAQRPMPVRAFRPGPWLQAQVFERGPDIRHKYQPE